MTSASRAARTTPHPAPGPAGSVGLAAIWIASVGVIAACTLASFRIPFAGDPALLLKVNGARVLLAAGVGAALALAGALRAVAGREQPLRELELLALSTGAAGGGFLLAGGRTGFAALVAFVLGAAIGAALFFVAVRAFDRPRRFVNLLAAAALAAMAAVAALAGTYARVRQDLVAPAVTWLLGDLGGASLASGAAVLALAALLLFASLRALRAGGGARLSPLALLAFGLGVGAAGPLAFVGSLVPAAVHWLGAGVSERALLPASAAAGAATVVAIDSVPRLLVGGYQFGFNLYAALLAVPIFLSWNRARLRRLAGPARPTFEALEIALIVGLTLAGAALAALLARVIRAAT